MELGRSLQNDFQNNQRRFWSRVKAPKRGSQEVQKICDDNGQVIEDVEGVMERWKDYFAGLLQGAQKEEEGNKDLRCVKACHKILRNHLYFIFSTVFFFYCSLMPSCICLKGALSLDDCRQIFESMELNT